MLESHGSHTNSTSGALKTARDLIGVGAALDGEEALSGQPVGTHTPARERRRAAKCDGSRRWRMRRAVTGNAALGSTCSRSTAAAMRSWPPSSPVTSSPHAAGAADMFPRGQHRTGWRQAAACAVDASVRHGLHRGGRRYARPCRRCRSHGRARCGQDCRRVCRLPCCGERASVSLPSRGCDMRSLTAPAAMYSQPWAKGFTRATPGTARLRRAGGRLD